MKTKFWLSLQLMKKADYSPLPLVPVITVNAVIKFEQLYLRIREIFGLDEDMSSNDIYPVEQTN